MPRHRIHLIILILMLPGCASTGQTLQVADFATRQQAVCQVAVLPMRLDLFQVQAGGNAELIDEWRAEANTHLTAALTSELGGSQGWQLTFAEKEYLRQYHAALWRKYRGLFETVARAAIVHGSAITAFPTKLENFDYTLGPGVAELAQVFNADALLFVYGTDYTATTGRKWVAAANLGLVESGSDGLMLGLVDGRSGDLLWLQRSAPDTNMNLRDAQFINRTIAWMCAGIAKDMR